MACIQVGTAANYVGAHFWNLQDEYLAIPPPERELSPATFLREVSPGSRAARSGLRYAPRLQAIDATDAFGALSTDAGSVLAEREADESKAAPTWSHRVERYVRRAVPHSRYVDSLLAPEKVDGPGDADGGTGLEDGVNHWSDYLKTRLHPRSCFRLPGVHHNVTNMQTFDFGQGLATSSLLEEMYDDLRFFVEECDSFGGLCVTTNADSAHAGVCAKYLSFLQEEFGSSSPVLVYGVHDVTRSCTQAAAREYNDEFNKQRETLWSQNEAKLTAACLELSAHYVPLSSKAVQRIPLLHATPNDLFHSSAVLGVAMDVSFVPLQQNLSLAGLLSALRPAPFASFGGLVCNFPSPVARLSYNSNLVQTTGSVSLSKSWSDTSSCNFVKNTKTSQSVSSSCTEVVAACGLEYSMPVFSNVSSPVTIPIPFPTILDASLERNRFAIAGRPRGTAKTGPAEIEQIAVLAGLATVSADAHMALKLLGESVRPSNRRSRAQSAARSSGVEDDELREVSESLASRAEDYLGV